MSKLGVFCDRLLEAGWLVVVGTVPLYFNIFSTRGFEPDKIVVLRCIVAVMALAQLVKWEEGVRGDRPEQSDNSEVVAPVRARWHLGNPLALPALAVLGTWLVASVTSITPAISFWGSYDRMQGTYSLLAYVVLFFLIAINLRRRAQVDRLFTIILLVSLPISLYGIAQHSLLDPLTWGSDTTARVTSTMGNAIFLAAYLIMVVPITLLRLVVSARRLRDYGKVARTGVFKGASGTVIPASILIVEVIGLALFAQASPANPSMWWAALPMAGLVVAAGLLFSIPRPTFFTTLAELAGYLALLALQLATLFLTGSRGPWIGMLAGLLAFVIATALRRWPRRLLAVTLAVAPAGVAFLVLFNLPNSPLAPLRETPYIGRLGMLSDTRADTVRVRTLIWQGTLDLLTRRPAIGLAENDPLGPARVLFGYGPESMFVAFNKVYPPDLAHYEVRNASPDRNHNDLLDIIVNVGVLGLAAYGALLFVAFRLIWRQLRRMPNFATQAALAAILGALVAHFVESLSGIVVAATREYFWVYLGILASGILWRDSYRKPRPVDSGVSRDERGLKDPVPRVRPVAVLGVLVLVGTLAMGWVSQVEDAQIGVILAFVGLMAAVVAVSLALGCLPAGRFCRTTRIPIYALAALAVSAVVVADLNPVAADIYFKRGLVSDGKGQYANGVTQYREAVRLAGGQDHYYLYLGRAYLELAGINKRLNAPVTDSLFDASRMALEQARDLSPLNTDHYTNLGRLYRIWGDPDDQAKLAQADFYYREATTLSPRAAHLYDEWAQVELVRGDLDSALDKTVRAAGIDAEFDVTFVLLGDIYLLKKQPAEALQAHRSALSINAAALSGPQFEKRVASYELFKMLPQLADVYDQAVRDAPNSAAARAAHGYSLLRLNMLPEARSELEASVRLAPNDWIARGNLAVCYRGLGMTDEAISSAREALRYAPAEQAAGLQAFLGELSKN